MQVIARRTLREFWARYPHAEGPIRAWVAIAAKARWANPAEIKRQFGSTVDFVGDNRVIFDLGGNKYRAGRPRVIYVRPLASEVHRYSR